MRERRYVPVYRFTFRVALPKGAFLTLGTGVPLNGARGPVRFLVQIAEAGKPAVVNCAGAFGTLRDGERVHLDGSSGRVERLDVLRLDR